jgi:hypothetical protein
MSHPARIPTATTALVLATIALGACDPAPTTPGPVVDAALALAPAAGGPAEVRAWLAHLRATLAPLHSFEAAQAAGYDTPITECMELPGTGGMGFHYGDPDLIDGVVEELKPEVLLFEPQKNGRMRLLGVEYIVPFTAWTGEEPPTLHGLTFAANETFQVWALHAWVWRHNPAGTFADWNPTVDCRYAP